MISEEQIEKAIFFLRDSANELGQLTGQALGLEQRIKIVEAIEYEKVEGADNARKMKARATSEYQDVVKEYSEVEAKLITLKAKREAASALISWSQSVMKMKAQGINL